MFDMRKISDKRESDITKKELVYDIMDEKIGVISDLSWKEKEHCEYSTPPV